MAPEKAKIESVYIKLQDDIHLYSGKKSEKRKHCDHEDKNRHSVIDSEEDAVIKKKRKHHHRHRDQSSSSSSSSDSTSSSSSSSSDSDSSSDEDYKRRHKSKHKHKDKHKKFMSDKHKKGRREERSAVSGQKIHRKLKKSKLDIKREKSREERLKFLNATM